MKCLQVSLNGKQYWTVGHEKVVDINFHLTCAPSMGALHISVMGTFPAGINAKNNKIWEQIMLGAEDEISLRMVDDNKPNVSAPKQELRPNDCKSSLCCSFCGKGNEEVAKLIAGPEVFICNECIEICADMK